MKNEFYIKHKKAITIILIIVIPTVLIGTYFLIKYVLTKSVSNNSGTGSKGGINNPGNIRTSSVAWTGKTTKDGDIFESFDTIEDGTKALYENLIAYRDKHNLNTIRGLISRWAPSTENNTSGYINFVSSIVGVDPDTELTTDQYPLIVEAISKQEGNHPLSLDQVNNYIA